MNLRAAMPLCSVSLSAAMLFLTACAHRTPVNLSPETASIQVDVRENGTKKPLGGGNTVLVQLATAAKNVDWVHPLRSVLTDTTGRVTFTGLAPGKHVLRIRSIGYDPVVQTVDVRSDRVREVEIVLKPSILDLQPIKCCIDF
jgi:hypothetical protein